MHHISTAHMLILTNCFLRLFVICQPVKYLPRKLCECQSKPETWNDVLPIWHPISNPPAKIHYTSLLYQTIKVWSRFDQVSMMNLWANNIVWPLLYYRLTTCSACTQLTHFIQSPRDQFTLHLHHASLAIYLLWMDDTKGWQDNHNDDVEPYLNISAFFYHFTSLLLDQQFHSLCIFPLLMYAVFPFFFIVIVFSMSSKLNVQLWIIIISITLHYITITSVA